MDNYANDEFDVIYDDELIESAEAGSRDGAEYTPQEAFVHCINRYGRVSIDYMAGLCGCGKDALIESLEGELIWRDPAVYDPDCPYEGWVTREQYIRGNIYRLLDEAREADRGSGLFAGNIELLKSVLPKGPEHDKIVIPFGATWIPETCYRRFVRELLDMGAEPPKLYLDTFLGKWVVKGGTVYNRARNIKQYGTSRMMAMRIIEHTLNATPIRITDKIDRNGKTKQVLNPVETIKAQEKQALILEKFQEWLKHNPKTRAQLEEIYTDQFGYQLCRYDGSFLELPGLNPDIELYSHQRSAIARIILSRKNVLLSHDVGAGKTYVFTAGIYERLRMGLSRKALLVVPKSVFEDTAKAIRTLYPDVELEAISTKDFVPAKRQAALQRIIDAESGFFMMPAPSFDKIDMSKEWRLKKKGEEINRCLSEINTTSERERKETLRSVLDKRNKEYREIADEKEDICGCFDRMNIDLLVVDECHNYKNIPNLGAAGEAMGIIGQNCIKSARMLTKCDMVRSAGGKLIFATGTPLTNSMSEIFVMQRYLQPEDLELLKLSNFSWWVNTYCTRSREFEIDATATSFRFVTRFSHFHNLPELMAMFGNVCDFYSINTNELALPEFNGYTDITVPRSDEQAAYIGKIVERAGAIRRGEVERTEDNYLKITTDGRKCALDIRLVEPELIESGEPESCKIRIAASEIHRIYNEYPGKTQAVFCDMSTPREGFSVYGDLKRLLVENGIPESEVVFIHDGSTESARERIIRQFNDGDIRVLIGSTAKLGLGVNIQNRLVAVHHIDVPWRPSDMVQREGRAIRQGNGNDEVLICRYVTESSFDAYNWQILENKQRFISSFLSGRLDPTHRTEDDIGKLILNYAEIKALAVGNPLIKERVEVTNELARIRAQSVGRLEELRFYQKSLEDLPVECDRMREQIRAITDDIRMYGKHRKSMSRADREKLGREILQAMARNRDAEAAVPVCDYRGFRVLVPERYDPGRPYILLQRQEGTAYRVDMKDAKAAGVSARIDNVLQGLPERKVKLQSQLDAHLVSKADAEKELKRGNPYEGKIEKLIRKLDGIDKKLQKEM